MYNIIGSASLQNVEMKQEEKQFFPENSESANTNKNDKIPQLNPEDLIHVLVVGDTGAGKSSLISLLTGDSSIARADYDGGVASCTKKVSVYSHVVYSGEGKIDKVFHFCDTPGTQDTDCKESDAKILNKTQRELYKAGAQHIKIIWIVRPHDKNTPTLQRQAQFINKFDNENSWVWHSMLMIVKQPNFSQSLNRNAQGAIAASNAYVSAFVPNSTLFWKGGEKIIGYTNIDWIPEGPEKAAAESIRKVPKLGGYYKYNKEIKDLVMLCLTHHIGSCELKWEIKRCIKCGIEGDERFVDDIDCHTKPYTSHEPGVRIEFIHLAAISNTGSKGEKFHCGQKLKRHTKVAPTRYHEGELQWMHIQQWKYSKTAIGAGIVLGGIGVGAAVATAAVGVGAVIGATLADITFVSTTTGVTGAVGGAVGGGINESIKNQSCYYPCCDGTFNSTGCKFRYSCCKGKENSKGCKIYPAKDIKYQCCGGGNESEGCFEYYNCCRDKSTTDKTNIGCTIHQVCTICDKTLVNSRGRKVNTKVNDKSCAFKWPCCNRGGAYDKIKEDDVSLHCKKYCDACKNPWNDATFNGCSPYATHQMISVKK